MKYKGSKLEPPKPFDIIIPRRGSENIHLKVQAVLDFEPFDKVLPEPQPPMTGKPGGEPMRANYKDKDFTKLWDEWWDRRQGWMFAKSLQLSEIEFDTMSVDDPNSCSLRGLVVELQSGGFLPPEVGYILKQIRQANAMDESHLEEARKRFLLSQAEQSE